MEVHVQHGRKTVEVWQSRAERNDPNAQQQVKDLCAKYRPQKYTVAVFQSGDRDLYQNALDLLIYNRRRAAELEVWQEKQPGKE